MHHLFQRSISRLLSFPLLNGFLYALLAFFSTLYFFFHVGIALSLEMYDCALHRWSVFDPLPTVDLVSIRQVLA